MTEQHRSTQDPHAPPSPEEGADSGSGGLGKLLMVLFPFLLLGLFLLVQRLVG